MNRRNLLQAALGASAAAAAGAKPSTLGMGNIVSGASAVHYNSALDGPEEPPAWQQALFQWMNAEGEKFYSITIPLHISTKKSWSEAFKHGEALREVRERQELWRLAQDPKTAFVLAKKLGLV